jgi:hypothetical protein
MAHANIIFRTYCYFQVLFCFSINFACLETRKLTLHTGRFDLILQVSENENACTAVHALNYSIANLASLKITVCL